MQRIYLILLGIFLLGGCGGGGSDGTGTISDPNNSPTPQTPVTAPVTNEISVSACTFTGDDSYIDPQVAIDTSGNRETYFTRSHTVGSPVYHVMTTRQRQDGSAVTIDYMVHTPTGAPKALVVLIAGGGLNAGITGASDGSTVGNSRGNYLVRSAHRFMAAGFLVVTFDRPSDYVDYNLSNGGYLYDQYRVSMDHAVDLANIIQRENSGNLPIIIAGTSRGAISAVANNILGAGIAISSPVTYDNPSVTADIAVGSTALPLSVIKRGVHLLLHSDDGCFVTTPADSRSLFANLDSAGIAIGGDEVTGGFSDSYRNDPCGAFDYHGYVGIENCAVSKETAWMESLVSALTASGNNKPEASNAALLESDPIDLSSLVSDADGDTLSYALPYGTTPLDGTVSINADTGIVTYTPPAGLNAGVLDSFAYVVTDGNGGVDTAVVTIEKQ